MIRWEHQSSDAIAEGFSTCTMEIERIGAAVKLSIRHTIDVERSKLIEKVSGGWPKVLSNLKSLLETGAVAMGEPYAKGRDYTTTIRADSPATQAVEAIDRVGAWWTKSFEGSTQQVGDTFRVRFGETFVVFEILEHTGERIVWRVKESLLPWLRDKTEWTGTDVVWHVTVDGRETTVQMTHKGLVPNAECYASQVISASLLARLDLPRVYESNGRHSRSRRTSSDGVVIRNDARGVLVRFDAGRDVRRNSRRHATW